MLSSPAYPCSYKQEAGSAGKLAALGHRIREVLAVQ